VQELVSRMVTEAEDIISKRLRGLLD